MLQLRPLRTFLAAAETLNFTRAAERVHLSQPAVTEQIRSLEEVLGKPLFLRANNRVSLTAAGERLAVHARELLALAEGLVAAVRDPHEGPRVATLRIAAPPTLCARVLAPLVASCASDGLAMPVVLLERNSSQTERAVQEGSADMGLLHGWPAAGEELEAELIGRDAPMVLLPQGHPLAAHREIEGHMLTGVPLVMTAPGCRYRAYVETLLQEGALRPRVQAEAESAPAVAALVAGGVGAAVLPRLAAEAAAAGLRVGLRPLRAAGSGLPICLVRAADRPLRPGVAAFRSLLRSAAAGLDQAMTSLDMQHFARGVAVAE